MQPSKLFCSCCVPLHMAMRGVFHTEKLSPRQLPPAVQSCAHAHTPSARPRSLRLYCEEIAQRRPELAPKPG